MKKFLLLIGFAIWASMIFAQGTATLTIGTVNDPAPGPVVIPVTLDAISNPNPFGDDLISGFALYFYYEAGTMSGLPVITMDSYWTTQGSYVTNTIIDQPAPGQNTIALVWATGGQITGLAPSSIANISFPYATGGTDLLWTTFKFKGGSDDAKTISYMVDYDGYDYVLTTNDGFVGSAGPTVIVWDGGGDGMNWFDPLNWDPNGLPGGADEVIINAVTKAPTVVISGGVASTAALTVAAGAGITIASDGGLTTNGLYTNNGDLLIQSDGLNGNAGTYINNAGIAGSGNFMFDRIVLCSGTVAGSSNDLGWHYLSAPFDGFTTDAVPEFFVNAWNQGAGMWMKYEGPIGLPCMPIAPAIPLNTMDAWSVNLDVDYGANCGPFDQTANFMSNAAGVHTGPYATPLGFGGGIFQEWNLVGNPYPSGLDVDAMTFGANTIQSTYFFDGCLGNYVYWTKGAPGMGTANSSVMAPTMGFFVETTGPDNLAVNDAMRAHNTDWFWKADVSNLLKIQATGNEKSDVLLVRFSDDATNGMDMQGDARKLFASTEGLAQIYTTFGDLQFAINSLPATESVPMGFKANGSGTYTIEAIETSEFENVVLEDLSNGVQTDLLAGSYTFDYTSGEHGFIIHFTPLGTHELAANSINIWAANQTIYVQAPATKGDIAVYNMMGQVVAKTAIVPGLNEIPMNTSNTYYIVKVLGSDVTETGKVFIK